MRRPAGTVAWIALVWLALWGDLSWANLLGGLAVGVAVVFLAPMPRRGTDDDAGGALQKRARHRIALAPALRYAAVFARDLIVATAEVARQVFWPIERLRPAVVAVALETRDSELVTLVANTITLTPGTLTLEADPASGMLWVHVQHLEPGGEAAVVEDARQLERMGAAALRVDLSARPPAGRSPR